MENYVQVGQFHLRTPDGNFLPAVPMFIKSEDAGGVNEQTGRTIAEEIALTDIAGIFAEKHKQYIQQTKAALRARKSE